MTMVRNNKAALTAEAVITDAVDSNLISSPTTRKTRGSIRGSSMSKTASYRRKSSGTCLRLECEP